MRLHRLFADLLGEARGRAHRTDPVAATTGGAAGNALLTAWAGLLVLGLGTVELVTLVDVRGLISWHVVVGVLLVPVALLKTATVGWRMVRYYAGSAAYRAAGPPPMLLRVLGPLVVVATLGVLGSGLALIAVGAAGSRQQLFGVLGRPVDLLTVHQALFAAFAVVTGLHLLARFVPALALVLDRGARDGTARRVPGPRRRVAALLGTLSAAVVAAALLLPAAADWQDDRGGRGDRPSTGQPSP